MDQSKNRFAAFTDNLVAAGGAGLVVGGLTFAIANNIGFREGCEIRTNVPACKIVVGDPLHTHQEGAPHFVLGTATHTGTANILEGNAAATGCIEQQELWTARMRVSRSLSPRWK